LTWVSLDENPSALTVSEYWPRNRCSNAKLPLESVLPELSKPTVVWRKVTDAFGTAAPLESKTLPEIAEHLTWADRFCALQPGNKQRMVVMMMFKGWRVENPPASEIKLGQVLEGLTG
jgi:hypothetical protein